MGLDLAPHSGGLEGAGQYDDTREERAQAGTAPWSPAVQVGRLGQLADGDEGDREPLAALGITAPPAGPRSRDENTPQR